MKGFTNQVHSKISQSLALCILVNFTIQINAIRMGLSIIHIIMVHRVEFFQIIMYLSP